VEDLFGDAPAAAQPVAAPAEAPAAPAAPAPAPAAPRATPANEDPFGASPRPTEQLLVMRTWIDNTGNFTVNGKLIAILDGKIRLLKENGKTCTVPMRRLSQLDAEYVQVIAGKLGRGVLIQLATR
jgi:hypothetical protein